MLINLTQKEIESAVKVYIASQGINTDGKTIALSFTTTRKGGTGISCEANITDEPVPGFETPEKAAPKLKAVKADKAEAKTETAKEIPAAPVAEAKSPAAEAPKVETPSPFVTDAGAAVGLSQQAEAKPVASLFG